MSPSSSRTGESSAGMQIDRITVRFGGLTAVDGVSLSVGTASLVGLLGPNGAGKTTLFNACSGLITPTSGRVYLHGKDITHESPVVRAQCGLGRTFQRMELYERLTVEENVLLGREARVCGHRLLTALWQPPHLRREIIETRDWALELCGLQDLRTHPATELSSGQRRLVELARAIAGKFDVLLLDEPSSGLDHAETASFGEVLRHLVEELGIGILLVEHDMSLVRAVCDYTYVLEFGKLIANGPTAEVMDSSSVRAAYLGVEAV